MVFKLQELISTLVEKGETNAVSVSLQFQKIVPV